MKRVVKLLIFCLWKSSFLKAQNPRHGHPAIPLGYPCHVIPEQSEASEETHCFPNVVCSETDRQNRYSRIDGLCNNLAHPSFGAAGSDFFHLVETENLARPDKNMNFFYENGSELPNARLVSEIIHGHETEDFKAENMSLLVMQFGQFLDHDITLTAEAEMCHKCGEEPVRCCDYYLELKNYTRDEMPENCWPIPIPTFDLIFNQNKEGPRPPRCLEFKRSQRAACRSARHGLADQNEEIFNEITHFIDASNIYGSSNKNLKDLRFGIHGVLKGQGLSHYLLPNSEAEMCNRSTLNFMAGDLRVNENPGLQGMHTLFAREHNRLASKMKALAIHKTDESIMLEARRYMIGQMQNIVYKEFLAEVLPQETYTKYSLDTTNQKSLYDANLSSLISVEFSTAAFRFGHTLVASLLKIYKSLESKSEFKVEALDAHFFNTSLIRRGEAQLVLLFQSLARQRAHQIDPAITDALRNKLFRSPNSTFGSDLASLNIQRGRDHQIGSYEELRIFCGLGKLPKTFASSSPSAEELRPAEFSVEAWNRLASVYKNPSDIELFPGGLSETPAEKGKLGPTFACIIAKQFFNLKHGDRYFFTHTNVHPKVQFTQNDLELIQKRTLRDVICDNIGVKEFQRKAFQVPSAENLLEDCKFRNRLEPQDLCLFGASQPTKKLKSPGYVAKSSTEVLVISGGFDGANILNSVEVYSPEGSCNLLLPNLPVNVYGNALFYMNGQLYACGGSTGIEMNVCHNLNHEGKWVLSDGISLNEPRMMGAFTVSTEGVIYFSGGWPSNNTLEYFDKFSSNWIISKGITSSIQHCMVTLPNGNLVILGGYKTGLKVQVFDVNLEEWISLPPLKMYSDRHDCILLPNTEDQIVVVGRYNRAEMYSIHSGTSITFQGPKYVRGFAKLARINDEIYVLGGHYHTNKVEKLVQDKDTGKFRFESVSYNLHKGRSRFSCTAVTKSYIKSLGYDCQ